MGKQRYRTLPLVLLSAMLGFTTGMLAIAGLAVLLADARVVHASPWLDPRSISNWVVLFCVAAAGWALALLAERADGRTPASAPDTVPMRSLVNEMPDIGARPDHDFHPRGNLARAA